MSNAHVAEVKHLLFKVQVYLYSSVSLHDQNPKMILNTKRYPIYMFTPTPDFQISLLFSTDICFRVIGPFETSAPNDPKMTLNTKRSKVPV